MSDVRDLLRKAVARPSRQLDVATLAATANERRRRRQLGTRGGAIAAAVVIVGAGAAVVFNGGERGRRIEVAAASTPSVDLPDGWQQLPVVERATSPAEVLVLGTADRPVGEPIQACIQGDRRPATRSAYVTLYEYAPTDALVGPAGDSQYTREAFVPRPSDFRANPGLVGECPRVGGPSTPVITDDPSTTSTTASTPTEEPTTSTSLVITPPAVTDHFREIAFVDGDDRLFLARIVSVDDPTGELLDQGFAVLNSLIVGTGEAQTTTTTAIPGFDEAAAKQQIVDAINAAYGTPSPVPSELSIEGGHPFASPEAAAAAAEKAKNADPLTRESYEGAQEGKLVAQINWIVFDSATYARLEFDVLNDGQLATATTTGYAVLEDGNWRLGRGTFCEIAARGGVNCPE